MASSFFSDFGLMWYLEELKKKEFMKFKELLKEETSHLGLKQIPWAEVKKASREELACLLLKHYEEEQAWDVTFRVFQRIDRRDLCERAIRESTGHSKLYQAHVREKYSNILAKKSIATLHQNLDETITQEEIKSLELLFTPQKPGKQAHAVLLKGNQGVGKTTFLIKFMLAWSKGLIYKDRFSYVFYFCCQELKQLPVTSLAELITSTWPSTSAPVSEILAHPEKVLFMVDSFEMLGSDLGEPEGELCRDWVEVRPPQLLLSSLLRRRMVPECSLLITVDIKARQSLEDRLRDLDVRVLGGFRESDIKLYIYGMFQDLHRAAEAFSLIQSKEWFLALCRFPVLCCLAGTALKHEMDEGKDVARTFQRTTSLYTSFLFNLFTPRTTDSPSWQGQAQLQTLCSLAAQGMWTNCFVFWEKDLRRNGIEGSDVPALLELGILLRCRGSEPSYKFLHPSIQEFCAALFYLLKSPGHHPHPAVQGTQDLLVTFLEKSRAYWVFLGCFLFGLLHERERQKLDAFFGFQLSSEVKQQVYQYLQSLSTVRNLHERIVFLALFYCLFEMQEETFVSQAMNLMQELTFTMSGKLDLEVAAYCLKHCSKLRQLSISIQDLPFFFPHRSNADLVCWHQVCSVLTTNKHLRVLQIKDSVLSDCATGTLLNQLRQPNCLVENLMINNARLHCDSWLLFEVFIHNPNVKYLSLNNTDLCRDAVRNLCSVLSHPTCVSCPRPRGHPDCKAFASILMEGRKLKQLNLASNFLKKGVRTLCKALCHPDCTLQFLVLAFCYLSNWCWDYLAEVLLTSKSLTHLDLSLNTLRDEGLKVLCEALRYPTCMLKTLSLMQCSITAGGCRDLAAVLTSNQNLTSLLLAKNHLGDTGVKLLCGAVAQPGCRLENLGLDDCGLTGACCEDLADMLTSSKTLTTLSLIQNPLDHCGVAVLCEGLRHPECTLRVLGLNKAAFDKKTQALLIDEEKRNPNLAVLES
uniref:NLR family pyrin domain containing 4 n=1 Tax=Chinchilla lanigera TaxID=34839 RepID=A0A8C2UHU3_CHILA